MIDLEKQELWLPEQALGDADDDEGESPSPTEEPTANTNPRALINQHLKEQHLLPDNESFSWQSVASRGADKSDNEATEIVELEAYLEDWLVEIQKTSFTTSSAGGISLDSAHSSSNPESSNFCPRCETLRKRLSILFMPPTNANSDDGYTFRHTNDTNTSRNLRKVVRFAR
jgi:hypothetical protein